MDDYCDEKKKQNKKQKKIHNSSVLGCGGLFLFTKRQKIVEKNSDLGNVESTSDETKNLFENN